MFLLYYLRCLWAVSSVLSLCIYVVVRRLCGAAMIFYLINLIYYPIKSKNYPVFSILFSYPSSKRNHSLLHFVLSTLLSAIEVQHDVQEICS
jgi:4-hydroxybenzoate polyprenyltransferase